MNGLRTVLCTKPCSECEKRTTYHLYDVPSSFPPVVLWPFKDKCLSLRNLRLYHRATKVAFACAAIACMAVLFSTSPAGGATAYTVNVQLSTATANPQQFQANLIAALTNQYQSTVAVNPSFPGAYTLKVYGVNPAYQPPQISTTVATLDSIAKTLVEISTWTYVYGWVDGEDYARDVDIGRVSTYAIWCSTPSVFHASTDTWNSSVCITTLATVREDIRSIKVSTPTIIPPGGN